MITIYLLTSFVDKLINMFAVYQKKVEYFCWQINVLCFLQKLLFLWISTRLWFGGSKQCMAKGGFKSRTANGLIRNNVACAVDCTLKKQSLRVPPSPKNFFPKQFHYIWYCSEGWNSPSESWCFSWLVSFCQKMYEFSRGPFLVGL